MTDPILTELGRQLLEVDADPPAWWSDPVAFATECIQWPAGQSLTPYRREILGAVVPSRRVTARAPHGVGKTALQALMALWFSLANDARGIDFKCLTTAASWRQLERYLWPEIHKWVGRIKWDVVCRPPFDRTELTALTLKLRHGQAFAAASDDAGLLEGAHADALCIVLDEAKSIIPDTWDAVEGALGGTGEVLALATSTPGAPSGRFFEIHQRRPGYEDWRTFHVSLEAAIAAGQIDPRWAEQRARQWGEDSAAYANRVLGQFHSGADDGVIPLTWLEEAVKRWEAWKETGETVIAPPVIGVDVGGGRDRTVICRRRGHVVEFLERHNTPNTMEVVGHALPYSREPGARTVIDAVGIGAGAASRLQEQHCSVHAFSGAMRSSRMDRSRAHGFLNMRVQVWWTLREALDPEFGPTLALPPDDELLGDLCAPRWTLNSSGKIQIEAKDEVRRRLGRSPDAGDAITMACVDFHGDPAWARDGGRPPERVAADPNAQDWSHLGVSMGRNGMDWSTSGPKYDPDFYFTHGGAR